MEIRFLGPLGIVTGSCSWLSHEGVEFLVDCGVEQEERADVTWSDKSWPFDPRRLRFVILTHAHADHCGLIPHLYKRGFTGTVYATRETAQIADIMLKDAAGLPGADYDPSDVDRIKWKEPGSTSLFGRPHPVATDLFIQFFRSAHVMGAVSVRILWGEPGSDEQRSIAFSGDLGPDGEDNETLPFLRHRMGLPTSDFAVLESTYGNRNRDPDVASLGARRKRLRALVDQVLETNGALLIPAFAFGRTQDVLFDLHWLVASDPERYAEIDVHLDSPLSTKLAPVIAKALERTESNGRNGKVRPLWLGKQLFRWLGLDDTDTDDFNRAIDICRMTLGLDCLFPGTGGRGNEVARAWRPLLGASQPGSVYRVREPSERPRVIVASSGMGDFGRAARWLQKLLPDPNAIVAFSGYCSSSSVGGRLLALAATPPSERRRLRGEVTWLGGGGVPEREILADVTALNGYSAHADQAGLMAWTLSQYGGQILPAGRTIFIQHGPDQARSALAKAIKREAREMGIGIELDIPTRANSLRSLDLEPAFA